MIDILEVLLSAKEKLPKREDRFCVVGEEDGKGNIIFHKRYIYNPKRKSKPVKMAVTDFWGTSESFVGGVYQARFLPKDKKLSEEESLKKLKRLQKSLKAVSRTKRKTIKAKATKPSKNKTTKNKTTKDKTTKNKATTRKK